MRVVKLDLQFTVLRSAVKYDYSLCALKHLRTNAHTHVRTHELFEILVSPEGGEHI